jgi:tRNA pseudouridine38-40 synthase
MRAYRIAYDGQPFYGFQRQPDVATVENTILDSLRTLDVLGADEDMPPGYAAAGRTDAGVSALAQTVAFEAPEWLTPRAVSTALPETIHAWAHADVPVGEPEATADFHATFDATSRRYAYHLHAPDADLALADEAASRLAGEHDFAALTPDDSGTVRTLATGVAWEEPFLVLQIAAGGFPRHLVRRIAALVELVATGERPPSFVDEVLASASDPAAASVPTALAEPLVLEAVAYPELSFAVDEDAAQAARAAIADRRIAVASRARVLGTLEERLDG